MITLEDWALIRRLAGEGVPKAQIAARLGVSRTTVAKAAASDRPRSTSGRRWRRRSRRSSRWCVELLATAPDMPATVIAERVGWTGAITWFRDSVRQLRPEHRPVDPADRLTWLPGNAAQCDLWFPPRKNPPEDGTRTLMPVFGDHPRTPRFMLARIGA